MMAWAVETLVATSLLIALVLAVRIPFARVFGARAAYALWLAPLLRLVSPPLPVEAKLAGVTVVTMPDAAAVAGQSGGAGAFGLTELLFAAWLAGAAAFLIYSAAAHHRFLRRAIRHGRRLQIPADGPELIESSAVDGPIATGIIRRRVFIPMGFAERLTPMQRDLAIRHEMLHHQRGDLLALAASLAVLTLHWFNPLAHYAHRLFRRDLEAACDAQLVARLETDGRQEYARAILTCAASPVPRAICTLTTIDDLKRRLTMLKWNHGTAARLTGTGFAAGVALAGLVVTAPVQAQTSPPKEETQVKIVRIGGDGAAAAGRPDIQNCLGEKVEASAQGEGNSRTRIVVCSKEGTTPAQMAERLERTVAHLEADGHLSADKKAEVIAQLRAKIAELRSR